ncbi:TonB-dependent receptor [Cyclobacterium sp. 1_MG-2023]|uniref:SusC/RagA family TonB-linked outer membrane protein n=1 Tax=Cyclobacterium sp. 1_MG-2023 TaxID=3062681 RepID=UPI0026E27CB7|nr:TonB-dependent receptor [Cyclobacterium sp. 1_MG-2023]MDO6438147.1 TonB-dependent receptor [Cyclobacterium sp. 1_MG-2023]
MKTQIPYCLQVVLRKTTLIVLTLLINFPGQADSSSHFLSGKILPTNSPGLTEDKKVSEKEEIEQVERAPVSFENSFQRERFELSIRKDIAIKGKVISKFDEESIPGVNVLIKGSAIGTVTDLDGNYSINAPEGAVLIFSFVGFITQEVAVNSRTLINVSLVEDVQSLDGVVVIGYGTQKKSDLTGSVTSVTAKEFEGQAFSNLNQALQGKVAGAEITSTSGEPGGAVQIRIRGQGTFGNSGPLYVIDGVPMPGNNINAINPNDIESITVLKDASASAIYGSRAANGVILVTTKKGVSGETKLEYNGYYGIQSFNNFIPMANSQQLADVVNDAQLNGGYAPQAAFNNPEVLKTDTDWQKAAFQTAPMQDHSLTVSGGGENSKFYLSGGYLDQEGVMVFSSLKRYSGRVNSEFTIGKGKKLKIGESLILSRSEGLNLGQANNLDFAYLLGASPTMKLYKPQNLGGYGGPNPAETGVNNRENIVGRRDLRRNYTTRNNLLGNVFAEYSIIPSLKYRLNAGINTSLNTNKIFVGIFNMDNRSNNTQTLNESKNESNEYLLEHTLSFEKVFQEKYSISLLGGYTQQNAFFSNLSGSKRDSPSNELQVFNAMTGVFTLSGNEEEWALRSFIGRANISIEDKYLFTATIRRDGSSRFGKENRYGNFPSFAAGWNIDREPFLQDISAMTGLKLRASWGKLGNQEIGNYSNVTTVTTAPRYFFGADQIAPASAVLTLGNPLLRWESTEQSNLGVNISFINNSLTLSADYWVKNTDGILLRTPVSTVSGVYRSNGAFQNAAGLKNSGFEFLLGYRKYVGDLYFDLTANLTTVRNEVTSLGKGSSIINLVENVYQFGTFTRTTIGEPMSSFYGYIMDGIFQTDSEIENHATQTGAAPGDVKFRDIDGNGIIDANDRTVIGDPFPDFNYGLSSSLNYKAYDLNFSFQGVQGKQLYNAQRAYLESMNGEHGQMATVVDRWTGPGTSNTMPRAIRGGANLNSRPSSRYVEDASYLRLQNVQIGYVLPETFLSKFGISNFRTYINAQNLFTITGYSNYSPDGLGGSGYGNNDLNPLSIGVDTGNYPIPRIIQLGLQVGF